MGCNKQICFNTYCRKNIFSDEKLKFNNDNELIKFALTTLQAAADPEELVCNESTTLERKSLKS